MISITTWLYIGGAALVILAGGYTYTAYHYYEMGKASCEVVQIAAQADQVKKVTKVEKKIKHAAPNDSNASAALNWVSDRVR